MPRLIFETIGAQMLLAAAVLAYRARPLDRSTRFSAVAAAGAFYLYLDDVFDLHVWLGDLLYNYFGWRPPPGINHFDDLIVMFTAIAGAAVVAWYRTDLTKDTVFAGLFGVSVALFAFAIVVDAELNPSLTLSWWTEEVTEFVASGFMAASFFRRWKWLEQGESSEVRSKLHLLAEPAIGE